MTKISYNYLYTVCFKVYKIILKFLTDFVLYLKRCISNEFSLMDELLSFCYVHLTFFTKLNVAYSIARYNFKPHFCHTHIKLSYISSNSLIVFIQL